MFDEILRRPTLQKLSTRMKTRDIIALLEEEGWELVRRWSPAIPAPQEAASRDHHHSGTSVSRHASRNNERYPETRRLKEMSETKYAVVIEKGNGSYGAYVPDLPCCVAVAETKAEVEKLVAEAITFHLESIRDHVA